MKAHQLRIMEIVLSSLLSSEEMAKVIGSATNWASLDDVTAFLLEHQGPLKCLSEERLLEVYRAGLLLDPDAIPSDWETRSDYDTREDDAGFLRFIDSMEESLDEQGILISDVLDMSPEYWEKASTKRRNLEYFQHEIRLMLHCKTLHSGLLRPITGEVVWLDAAWLVSAIEKMISIVECEYSIAEKIFLLCNGRHGDVIYIANDFFHEKKAILMLLGVLTRFQFEDDSALVEVMGHVDVEGAEPWSGKGWSQIKK